MPPLPDPADLTDSDLNALTMRCQVELQKRSVLDETPQRVQDAARPFLTLGGEAQVLHDALDASVTEFNTSAETPEQSP